MTNEGIHGRETILNNGELMSKKALAKEKFSKNDRIFIKNETYNSDFLITEERSDNGVNFRRIAGGGEDVVVNLTWLQQEYAKGKLKRYDKQNNLIEP